MNFTFVYPGWEGSASDSAILEDAKTRGGFTIPDGMVDILDAGFALSGSSLTPYRSVRYHLKEWKHGRERYDYFLICTQLLKPCTDLRMRKNFLILGMRNLEML